MLHAYVGFYFAIRSGKWFLRNTTLRILTEVFFAYARDKYEELSVYSLADALTYPEDILKYFKNGEWTVSVKGRPFLNHNIALDEAHESIVNRKLKQITSRPSHFRMVELADFMSYLIPSHRLIHTYCNMPPQRLQIRRLTVLGLEFYTIL